MFKILYLFNNAHTFLFEALNFRIRFIVHFTEHDLLVSMDITPFTLYSDGQLLLKQIKPLSFFCLVK